MTMPNWGQPDLGLGIPPQPIYQSDFRKRLQMGDLGLGIPPKSQYRYVYDLKTKKWRDLWAEQKATGQTQTTVPTKATAPVAPTTTPEIAQNKLQWYVPGLVLFNPTTNTYWDASSQAQYTKQQADAFLNQYNKAQMQNQGSVQSLPIQAQWQLQELARTRQALGVTPNPYFAGVEQSIQDRLQQGADITPEDLAMLDRVRQAEILSKTQEANASGSVMAERLGQQNQWRNDQSKLLAGLPTGPEGDVARWHIQNIQSPYKMLGRVGTEPSANETGAQPLGPPAPSWLPEFVPGTAAGEPIGGYYYPGGRTTWDTRPSGTNAMPFVPTPSGQQLTRMSPSQTQWLSGALNWYGQRPFGDILNEANMMQPATPRGAGQRNWRPSRQV